MNLKNDKKPLKDQKTIKELLILERPDPREDQDRKKILSILNEAIDQLIRKIRDGRIKNPENEKVRVQYYRALAYTCSVYNQVKQAEDLELIKAEIEAIKEQFKYFMR